MHWNYAKSWKRVQLLKRSGIIEYITASFPPVVNGCCSIVANTWNPIFLSSEDSWRTFNFFLLSSLYRFQRGGEAAPTLEFNSGPLNFCHCERKQALTVSKAISIAIDSNTSFLFLLARRSIHPFMGHFVRKNWGQRFARSNCFRTVSNWEKKFFPPLLAQFNFHIIDRIHCRYIYIFLIIFYGEKLLSVKNIIVVIKFLSFAIYFIIR